MLKRDWHLDESDIASEHQFLTRLAAHAEAPRLFIHGDFTTDNILIDGEPPTIVGAIDFALTNREVVLADVAFGL